MTWSSASYEAVAPVSILPFFGDHRAANPQTAIGGAFDIYTVNVQ